MSGTNDASSAGHAAGPAFLEGAAPTPGLREDLLRLLGLPAGARTSLWTVLGPSLQAEIGPDVDALLQEFCRRHGIADAELALGLKAARFVLREAARLGVDRAQFANDLNLIGGGEYGQALGSLFLGRYDEAVRAVRNEVIAGTILDHGRLLQGVDWRIDVISDSQRGDEIRTAVAMLTFRYREGDREERFSLQALPDEIAALRAVCDRIIGPAKQDG